MLWGVCGSLSLSLSLCRCIQRVWQHQRVCLFCLHGKLYERGERGLGVSRLFWLTSAIATRTLWQTWGLGLMQGLGVSADQSAAACNFTLLPAPNHELYVAFLQPAKTSDSATVRSGRKMNWSQGTFCWWDAGLKLKSSRKDPAGFASPAAGRKKRSSEAQPNGHTCSVQGCPHATPSTYAPPCCYMIHPRASMPSKLVPPAQRFVPGLVTSRTLLGR